MGHSLRKQVIPLFLRHANEQKIDIAGFLFTSLPNGPEKKNEQNKNNNKH